MVLENKKIIVICSILSIFPSHQKKNRKIFEKYIQIYLKAKSNKLKVRTRKFVYNLRKNVVGKDIVFPKPYKNDFVFQNTYDSKINNFIKKIIKKIN